MVKPSTIDPDVPVDVLVVGAGPVGLMVAAELALGGAEVRIIDRLERPSMIIKAAAVTVATAELFDRRGLLPAAREIHAARQAEMKKFFADRRPTPPADAKPAPTGPFPAIGHFGGLFFRSDLVDQNDPLLLDHLTAVDGTSVWQQDVEALFTGYLDRFGVGVTRGVEVTGLEQIGDVADDDAPDAMVRVDTDRGAIVARWVVAADGGRSFIRRQAGFDFPGTDPETVGYQAVAEIDHAEELTPGWNWTPAGLVGYGPTPGRILTIEFDATIEDRDAPVTVEEVRDALWRVSGTNATVTAFTGGATRSADSARQASTYRRGRVLLAGDAAHVHSPLSGQGLNLGVGDAMNLGWKLAAVVAGRAPAGLLDTYTAERHPVGAAILDWTRAQVAVMRRDPKSQALRSVVAGWLDRPDATTRIVARTVGLEQAYDMDGNGHPLVGRLVGDTTLSDGGRLADHAHRGTFVLLDRSPDRRFAAAVAPWSDVVAAVTDEFVANADVHRRYAGVEGLLIRPDGVIAWAHDAGDADGDDVAALTAALNRWAGEAARELSTP